MPNHSSNILAENLESIQAGFQRVLDDHGVSNLKISNFRLSPAANEDLSLHGLNTGCWRWVCELTPSGQVCHKVWDPNC